MQGFTGEKTEVSTARIETGFTHLRYEDGLVVTAEELSERTVAIRECAALVDRRAADLLEDRDGLSYSAVLACRELAEDICKLL